MSLGLTLIRESFNFWTPTYLAEVGMLSAGEAAQYSLLFPLFGGVSVLVFGYLADHLAGGKRSVGDLDRGGPAGVGARLYGEGSGAWTAPSCRWCWCRWRLF